MKEPTITYRGWAGHFILSQMCKFRLNTLIELNNTRVIVSTVGLMNGSLKPGELETISGNRYFETMAFDAKFDGKYWDADVSREIEFDSNWSLPEIDMENEANEMHQNVIDEIVSKMKSGDIK